MTTLIVVAALATWTYDGFVADPSPEAPASTTESTPEDPFDQVSSTMTIVQQGSELVLKKKSETPAPAKERDVVVDPAPIFDPSVKKWRLADHNGQVWEHSDPDWLVRWIAEKNSALKNQGPPSETLPND